MSTPYSNEKEELRRDWEIGYILLKMSKNDQLLYECWWPQFKNGSPECQERMLEMARELLKEMGIDQDCHQQL